METKDILLELRTKNGLSQEELAEKVMVTRQKPYQDGKQVKPLQILKH